MPRLICSLLLTGMTHIFWLVSDEELLSQKAPMPPPVASLPGSNAALPPPTSSSSSLRSSADASGSEPSSGLLARDRSLSSTSSSHELRRIFGEPGFEPPDSPHPCSSKLVKEASLPDGTYKPAKSKCTRTTWLETPAVMKNCARRLHACLFFLIFQVKLQGQAPIYSWSPKNKTCHECAFTRCSINWSYKTDIKVRFNM